MTTRNGLLALVLAYVIGGCGTIAESGRTIFPFTYENTDYEIISVVVPTDGGSNYLTLHQGGQLVLHAKDEDQDGTLDTLMVGDITLDTANHIYEAGLAEAQAQGKYKLRASSRIYSLSRNGDTFIIQTYMSDKGASYNRFTRVDAVTQQEAVLLDTDVDSVLDHVESGEHTLEESQAFYEMVLQEGIRDGRITRIEDRYVVQPRRTERRPSAPETSDTQHPMPHYQTSR